ncbi:IS21 family transposase [Mesorhizobium sp. M0179]
MSAIARESGIDRKTVRKYIARGLEAPAYGPRKPRQAVIDPFTAYLRERVTRYPGLTGSRLFRELKNLGYGGGYTAVTDFLRDVRPAAAERGYEVRFETPPGEQAQTTPRIVWLFSMVLGFSRLIWARFVVHQDLPTVLRCHAGAFEALGGAPREVLYDRMKTAVIGEGDTGGIVYNRALVDLARQLPRQNKRQGRATVPLHSRGLLPARSFRNLEDLNAQLRHWLDTVANPRVHATTRRVVNEAFAEERAALRPLPLAPFRSVLKLERRISREGVVSVGGNFYSVPDATRRRVVEVHTLAEEVRIFEDGALIAIHPILEGRHQRHVEPGHRNIHVHKRRQILRNDEVILHGSGDRVAQRPLAFYDAVARVMAKEQRP